MLATTVHSVSVCSDVRLVSALLHNADPSSHRLRLAYLRTSLILIFGSNGKNTDNWSSASDGRDTVILSSISLQLVPDPHVCLRVCVHEHQRLDSLTLDMKLKPPARHAQNATPGKLVAVALH